MCKIMEERVRDTEYRKAVSIAANFLRIGTVSKEDIARATGLPIETIIEIEKELKEVPA